MKLPREFYQVDGLELAPKLLGKTLVHNTKEGVTKGVIVEVEAYLGSIDKAAHSCNRRTARTEIMYGPGGFAYVYLIYGMHSCMNIVANDVNIPHAILIRALEPSEGLDLMRKRRKTDRVKNLCSGPGKLCQALAIDKTCYGLDLCGDELYLEETKHLPPFTIETSKRINVDYAEEARDFLWRFTVKDSPYLSVCPGKGNPLLFAQPLGTSPGKEAL